MRHSTSCFGSGGWFVLAAVCAALGALAFGLGVTARDAARATGWGTTAGAATVAVGEATLDCTFRGPIEGETEPTTTESGADAENVDSQLDADGQCVPPTALANGSPIHLLQPVSLRQEVLTQVINATLTGQIVERSSDQDGILEYPADATYRVSLDIETTSIGTVHTREDQPMLLDCPNISSVEEYACFLQEGTIVNLYDETEEKVTATITALAINSSRNNPNVEAPLLGGGPLVAGGSTLLLVGIAGLLALMSVLATGAGVLASRRQAL